MPIQVLYKGSGNDRVLVAAEDDADFAAAHGGDELGCCDDDLEVSR